MRDAGRCLTVCLNPVMQRTLYFSRWRENEVNRTSRSYIHASGKGVNVARVFTQLGGAAVHLTHAGGRQRDRFLELLADDGVNIRWVDSGSEIRTCTTVLSDENNSATELVEESEAVNCGTEKLIRELFEELISRHEVLTISGTKSPGYSDSLFAWMTERASRAGKAVILDIRGRDLELALNAEPALIKPNFTEFCTTFLPEAVSSTDSGEHEHAPALLKKAGEIMQKLYSRHGIKTMLTRGSMGVFAYDGDTFYNVPAHKLNPVNTIGCGDAFTAGVAFALSRESSFTEAMEQGTVCAAANAMLIKPGAIH